MQLSPEIERQIAAKLDVYGSAEAVMQAALHALNQQSLQESVPDVLPKPSASERLAALEEWLSRPRGQMPAYVDDSRETIYAERG